MNELKRLLYILGCTLKGEKPDTEFDIENIYNLAINQGIWHIIYETLEKYYNLSAYKMRFLTTVTKSISANEFVYDTIKKLEADGISCCYLKGIAIARLYPSPDCRISSDTDILIKPENQERTIDILKSLGYTIGEIKENFHHFQATHPKGKLLEVHTMMYSKPTRDVILSGENLYNEQYIEVETSVGKVKTLGINDGLIFLTVHFIKHFLSANSNLRQMTDLLLYMKHYYDEIDWERYNAILKKLSYDKLIDGVKELGNIYFSLALPIENTGYSDTVLTCFLEDNKDVYYEFCSAKTDMNKIEYINYINNNSLKGSFIKRIFPPTEIMNNMGYKTDNLFKLLISYLKRILYLIKRTLKRVKKKENNAKMELLKKLGMIE